MRILLVSDLHANAAALDAIREPCDVCICLGDIVEYGPNPSRVIAWVRQHADYCVRGNHDHGTAQNVDITGIAGFRYLTAATRHSTINAISPEDRQFLAELPTTKLITLAGKRFLLVHASPRDPLDEYVPNESAAWSARLAGWDVDYVCAGHTHQPFIINAGKTTVINPGSVGLQRDGDPRARYAIIEPDGRVVLKSLEYDVETVIDDVNRTNYDAKAKVMLADVYRTGKYQHTVNGSTGSIGVLGDARLKAIA
jgi:putative phosphoesterase